MMTALWLHYVNVYIYMYIYVCVHIRFLHCSKRVSHASLFAFLQVLILKLSEAHCWSNHEKLRPHTNKLRKQYERGRQINEDTNNKSN